MTSLKGHVLVVDDLEPNRDALMRMLRKEGLVTSEAKDGLEALELIQKESFDTILLDVMMPRVDGMQVLKTLKEDPAHRDIPVIMLSAMQEAAAVRQCIEIGADDFLPKPFDRLLLRARLTSCLRKKQLQDKEKEYLSALENTNAELRRVNQLKSRFLAIAAHDLKNPLSTVHLLASQIADAEEDELPPAHLKKAGERISASVHKMLGIIQGLLDSAAMEAGHLVLKKSVTDLHHLAENVAEENRVYATSKSVRLQFQSGCTQELLVLVDVVRVREVFDNLVNNAIKFSPPDSEVIVSLDQLQDEEGHWILFQVRDQGPGLTEEDKTKVFGHFQRLSAQPTGGEVSTGLGLSIVKQLIELHGGTASVESEAGHGACFCIKLPFSPVSMTQNP